jgi:3-deoxy-D-manno-octulosonate 8-phosphate phosphatase (KDO 8-P phosphatase)
MNIEDIFSNLGGEFITPYIDIIEKLRHIKAYLFDWDGVFNAGVKGEGTSSTYTEPDSMGTNLLRFGHFLKNNELPLFGIITGQKNPSAFQFSKREHLHFVYYNLLHKIEALDHIQITHNIQPHQVAFVFDDVLDLSIASHCGLRFLIRRQAGPLLETYVKENGLCDYISANSGSQYGVREVCELVLGISGVFSEVVDNRVEFSNTYHMYLSKRNSVSTAFYTKKDGIIVEQ